MLSKLCKNSVIVEPNPNCIFQILEEIRITTDIDLERNVESFLPVLFEKLSDNSMFILGKKIFNQWKLCS